MDFLILWILIAFFTSEAVAANDCSVGVELKTSKGKIQTYSTISAAIDAAPNDSVITIGSGTYNEKLRVNDKVDLSINSECSAKLQSISFKNSKRIKLNGFSFEPKSNGEDHIVLFENNSHIILMDNQISSQAGDGNRRNGIKILDFNKEIYITNNKISENGKNGITISGLRTLVYMKDNVLENNGMNGLLLQDGASAMLIANSFRKNGARNIGGSNYAVTREGSYHKSCSDDLLKTNYFKENAQLFGNRDILCIEPDEDGDKYPNTIDNNPIEYNPNQEKTTRYPVVLTQSDLGSAKYRIETDNDSKLKYIIDVNHSGIATEANYGGIVFNDDVQVFFGKNSFKDQSVSLGDVSVGSLNNNVGATDLDIVGKVYDFKVQSQGYNFNEPVQITFTLDPLVSYEDLSRLRVAIFDPDREAWESFGGEIDPIQRTITARVPHFSWITTICRGCKIPKNSLVGSFIYGANVTLNDFWHAVVVNSNGLYNELKDILTGETDLIAQISKAISECSDIKPYLNRILAHDLSTPEGIVSAQIVYTTVSINWAANCAAHLITGEPEYSQTYPSNGIGQALRTPVKRSILEMWSKKVLHDGDYHDALNRCDGLIVEDHTFEPADRKHCSAGDALLFSALMNAAAPNIEIQNGIRSSVDGDGRPWRSPINRAYPTNSFKDFSKDHILGLLIYLAKSRDRELALRFKDYLTEHKDFVCPYDDTPEAISQCYATPPLISQLNIILNLTGGGGRKPSAAEQNAYDELELSNVQNRKLKSTFEYHLSGAKVYLRHLTGTMTPKMSLVAKSLYELDSRNLFFKYLYKLTDPNAPYSFDEIAQSLLSDHIEGWVRDASGNNGYYSLGKRSQWVWNRPTDLNRSIPDSVGWDYLFILGLLDPRANLYKENQDFSMLTLPPPGMYMFSGLFELSYYILYPGNITGSGFDYKTCKIAFEDEYRAFLKGWDITNQEWNSGAAFIFGNETVEYEGACTTPIIAGEDIDREWSMSTSKILEQHIMTGPVYKAFSYTVTKDCPVPNDPIGSQVCEQSSLNCQKACLIDQSCAGINLHLIDYETQPKFLCRMLSSIGEPMLRDPNLPAEWATVHTSRKYPVNANITHSPEIGCESGKTSLSGSRRSCSTTQCFSVSTPLGFIDAEQSINTLTYRQREGSEHGCDFSISKSLGSDWVTEICVTAHARSHSGSNGGPGKVFCSFDLVKFD